MDEIILNNELFSREISRSAFEGLVLRIKETLSRLVERQENGAPEGGNDDAWDVYIAELETGYGAKIVGFATKKATDILDQTSSQG